jgi:hypothetical protein
MAQDGFQKQSIETDSDVKRRIYTARLATDKAK